MSALDVAGDQRETDDAESGVLLPPRPTEPLPSDCCGLGCTPCVYDLYEQELALWRADCEKIRNGESLDVESSSEVELSPDEYTMFELYSISQVTADCYKYTFIVPKHRLLPLAVGQHMVLRWKKPDKIVTRQYTPIIPTKNKGRLEFIIKIYANGEMSQYIKTWKPGDMIEWRGPFGSFTYSENAHRHIVMLAAGTGITPMLQLIQHVLDNERDETTLHLVYACRSYSAILCKDILDQWSDYWNFSVIYILSKESKDDSVPLRYGDQVVYGTRLTEDMVRQYVMDFIDCVRVLVCGTKSFERDMLSYLSNMDIPQENIFKF